MYVLPLLSLAVIGLSFFLSPPEETVVSALVLGGPTDMGPEFSGRAQVTGLRRGVEIAKEAYPFRIEGTFGTRTVSRSVTTGPGGWAEFSLPRQGQALSRLKLTDSLGRELAAGEPNMSSSRWSRAASVRGGGLRRHQSGALAAQLFIERAVLAVPFAAKMTLDVSLSGDADLRSLDLSLEGDGVEILRKPHWDEVGKHYSFEVRPLAHSASLRVSLSGNGESLLFEESLSVIPGALDFTIDGDRVTVVSPIVRQEAWFTYVTERERLVGGWVPLKQRPDGISVGEFSVPAAAKEAEYLVLSSSPEGRTMGVVGYPLRGQRQTFDAVDGFLLDGGPRARQAFVARARATRNWIAGYAGVSFFLTLVLFAMNVRRKQRELAQNLDRVGAEEGAYDRSAAPLLIASLCLFFAFSAAVLWIVAR